MSASFALTLDTAAPEVSFGEFDNPKRGSLLVIPYTTDEPQIVASSLQDSAGTLWPFTIYADRIELNVDQSAGLGAATIITLARDAVLNEITYEAITLVVRSYEHHEPPLGGNVFTSSQSGVAADLATRGIEPISVTFGTGNDHQSGGVVLVYSSSGWFTPVERGGTLI